MGTDYKVKAKRRGRAGPVLCVGLLLAAGCTGCVKLEQLVPKSTDSSDGEINDETQGSYDSDPSPVITGIEGSGSSRAIAPRPEDKADWNAHASDRVAASHRIDSFDKLLIVTGEHLGETYSATAVGQNGQGSLEFEIVEKDDMQIKLKFPSVVSAAAGGLFLLTLAGFAGDASAQVFFLQGEQGPQGEKGDSDLACVGGTCTLAGNLEVTGEITATSGVFDDLDADALAVNQSIDEPARMCPEGYTRDTETMDIVLCRKGGDEMVKVGSFWIDRYEMSMWHSEDCTGTQYGAAAHDYPSTFPDNGNWTTEVYACSKREVTPSRFMTWFQAQQACELSGKRLCSNEEWQAAAAGTRDPGTAETGTQCRISATNTEPRSTGLAGSTPGGSTSCISTWGAEDMIGNLAEMTAMWSQAGPTWATEDAAPATPFPGDYFSDGTWNVNGSSFDGSGSTPGLPGVPLRGGAYNDSSMAGAFAMSLASGATNSGDAMGARCCKSR